MALSQSYLADYLTLLPSNPQLLVQYKVDCPANDPDVCSVELHPLQSGRRETQQVSPLADGSCPPGDSILEKIKINADY